MRPIIVVVGARPNFMKMAPLYSELKKRNLNTLLLHTGQHYDANMSKVFFDQFKLKPDYFLNIKPSTPNTQIAEIMMSLESLFHEVGKPDWFIVPGDVNSTLAGAITANKMGIKLSEGLNNHSDIKLAYPTEANEVFAKFPRNMIEHLNSDCLLYTSDAADE